MRIQPRCLLRDDTSGRSRVYEWRVCMCRHTQRTDYSVLKKNEIWLFVTIWINRESVTLSEVSQRKTNTIGSQLYVESKKQIKPINNTEADP